MKVEVVKALSLYYYTFLDILDFKVRRLDTCLSNWFICVLVSVYNIGRYFWVQSISILHNMKCFLESYVIVVLHVITIYIKYMYDYSNYYSYFANYCFLDDN